MQSISAGNFQLTPEAINYCWRQLALRIGFPIKNPSGNGFETLQASIHYGLPGEIQMDRPGVVVVPTNPLRWHELLHCEPNTLKWIPVETLLPPGYLSPVKGGLPVLFWGEDGQSQPPVYRMGKNIVIFNIDIIATVLFMLTRWEEAYLNDKDHYDRFPGTSSLAYKQSFLDHPIVDEYALILRAWIENVFPEAEHKPRSFSVKLSHDIDYIYKYSNWKKTVRYLILYVFVERNVSQITEALNVFFDGRKDPYYSGILELADLSRIHGLKSAFYFMTAAPSKWEAGYWETTKLMTELIESLILNGYEVGLHPSHDTLNNLDLLREEKKRLSEIMRSDEFGGRQHNLRFKAPETWRNWEETGLKYDSTMAYADHEGFRCGTCYPYNPFDIEKNREINLVEEPLIVMDVTLKRYTRLTPDQGKERILYLAQTCKDVGGVFTLLWHNSSLDGEWRQWAEVYREVLASLTQMQK